MINHDIKLNPNIFNPDVEKASMRDGFGEGLVLAGEKNKDIYVLTADLRESTRVGEFANKFPSRFIEVGVAEQNLVTVASGIATEGRIPVVTSYAVFSPGRNWEQIRTTVCYNNQPVKIIGSHAGINVGPDGATHQALEDIALMRVLPNMVVLSPADMIEAKKATLAMLETQTPVYLRLPRFASPIITTEESNFNIGKAEVLNDGNNATIIATGHLVYQALQAAKELAESKISVRVINCSTIKPLDRKTVLQAAEETKAIVTLEDHQITGGLGGAVAELIAQEFPVPLKIMGVQDKFGESGEAKELLDKYGLTVEAIIRQVITVLRMKGGRYV